MKTTKKSLQAQRTSTRMLLISAGTLAGVHFSDGGVLRRVHGEGLATVCHRFALCASTNITILVAARCSAYATK